MTGPSLTLTFSAYDGYRFTVTRDANSILVYQSEDNLTKKGDRIKGEPTSLQEAFIKSIDTWIEDALAGKFEDNYAGESVTICHTYTWLWGLIPRRHTRYFYIDPETLKELAGYIMAYNSALWAKI